MTHDLDTIQAALEAANKALNANVLSCDNTNGYHLPSKAVESACYKIDEALTLAKKMSDEQAIQSADAFDYERVRAWALSTPRKAANQAFTASTNRNVAYLIEDIEGKMRDGGWQDISTAPKDGTEILVAYARCGFVKKLVNYNTIHRYWVSKGVPELGLENNATHWMYIPGEPPASGGDDE